MLQPAQPSRSPASPAAVDITPEVMRARTSRFVPDITAQIDSTLRNRCDNLARSLMEPLELAHDPRTQQALSDGIRTSLLKGLERALSGYLADPNNNPPPDPSRMMEQFQRTKYLNVELEPGRVVQVPTRFESTMDARLERPVRMIEMIAETTAAMLTSETRRFHTERGLGGTFRPKGSGPLGGPDCYARWSVDEVCCGRIEVSAHLGTSRIEIALSPAHGTELQRYQLVRSFADAASGADTVSSFRLETLLREAEKLGATVQSTISPVCEPRMKIGNWVIADTAPERSQYGLGQIDLTAVSADGNFEVALFSSPSHPPTLVLRPRDKQTGEAQPTRLLELTGRQSSVDTLSELRVDMRELLSKLNPQLVDGRCVLSPDCADGIKKARFDVNAMENVRLASGTKLELIVTDRFHEGPVAKDVLVENKGELKVYDHRRPPANGAPKGAVIDTLRVEEGGSLYIENGHALRFVNTQVFGTIDGKPAAASNTKFDKCYLAPSTELQKVLFGMWLDPQKPDDRFYGCRIQTTGFGIDTAHFSWLPKRVRDAAATISKTFSSQCFEYSLRPLRGNEYVPLKDL
ncbi:MAG: hypothetical protein QY326_08925 [Bdellovibrionota bacterium]|nr:MAG: hypothetical protein QY326_08925 [Bdellovibrionota bacterium]